HRAARQAGVAVPPRGGAPLWQRLRLLECLSLRMKDVDLDRHQIIVRRGKGHQDRATLLPARAREAFRAQLDVRAERHRGEPRAARGPSGTPRPAPPDPPPHGPPPPWGRTLRANPVTLSSRDDLDALTSCPVPPPVLGQAAESPLSSTAGPAEHLSIHGQ